MESLEKKFEDLDKIFWRDYIHVGDAQEQGTNIPCECIHGYTKMKHMGDGTVNLAQLMTYLYFCEKNGEKRPITLLDCMDTLYRLSANAKKFYEPVLPWDQECSEFFLRDDCNQCDISWGSWKMLHGHNVDPCHSPFISQDQVWNLSPILAKIGKEVHEHTGPFDDNYFARYFAASFGYSINAGIALNGYKVVNPYLSYLAHLNTYLPSFKLSVEDRRMKVRNKNPKPIKVKRGANNWYYSGGTQACMEEFDSMLRDKEQTFTLRKLLYKGLVFFLDRIYEPTYRLFTGRDFKHNSYYCYAATSGIWYNSKFKERFFQRFAESLEKWRQDDSNNVELFEPNIAPLVIDDIDDWYVIKYDLCDWLERYSPKTDGNVIYSPLEALTLYEWYKYMCNLK